MVQGLFGGATSYEGQSLNDIILDIENWCNYTNDSKLLLIDHKQKLISNGFWDKIPFNFKMTLLSTITYFDTILHDLNLIKNSIISNTISEREVNLLRKIGLRSSEFNREYGQTFKEEYNWRKYGNADFKIAEEMYVEGRDLFVTLQDASNAASRLEDYMINPNVINNNISINGDVSNSQVQQGTINSTQKMTIDPNFDYEKLNEILNKIQKYYSDDDFNQEFNENADRFKQTTDEIIEMVRNREEPFKIKKSLKVLRDLAIGVSGSIIATGICTLIGQFLA